MAEEAPCDQVTLDLEHIKEESKDDTTALGDVFTERIASLMKHRDVDAVLSDQQHIVDNLEMMNEKLKFLNSISQSRYDASVTAFRFHMRLLANVKKDLDSVFRRIRTLKTKLGAQHPEIMAEVQEKYTIHVSDDDDDDDDINDKDSK